MQLELPGRPHLTYCTNIHAGESWNEIHAALQRHAPAVKQRVSPDAAMGIGLRLSGAAADRLAEPEELHRLADFLGAHGLYVFTINAFPYGPFHGVRVKEGVYEPDWRDGERLRFTDQAAGILAELLPCGMEGSVSTVPGAFRPNIRNEADVDSMADALLRHAAHLHRILQTTGKTIVLALEPEPWCFIESTDEAIAFFERYLFGREAVARFAEITGVAPAGAVAGLRRHLGLCFDVCHAAVGFEDVSESLDRIAAAGIRVAKLQLSCALKLEPVGEGAEALLEAFDDGVYLHQTVAISGGGLTRYLDLPDAFSALRRGEAADQWRVHCHVPLFCASYGALQSTQDVLEKLLGICRSRAVAPHLEVETYTWGVLPAGLRNGDISGDIARELTWVRSQLDA